MGNEDGVYGMGTMSLQAHAMRCGVDGERGLYSTRYDDYVTTHMVLCGAL